MAEEGEKGRARGEKRSPGGFRALLFFSVLLVGALILQVALQIHMKQIGYDIAGELKRREHLLEENKRLKVERATLRSAGRIEALARERLNMDYPAKDQIIFMK